MANPSSKGIYSYAGMMVNYLYDMEQLDKRAKQFQDTMGKSLPLGEDVQKILGVNAGKK
jgi:hypothetical protein